MHRYGLVGVGALVVIALSAVGCGGTTKTATKTPASASVQSTTTTTSGATTKSQAVAKCLKISLINKSNGETCSHATVSSHASKTEVAQIGKLRVTCTPRGGTNYLCRGAGAPAIIQPGCWDVEYDGKTVVYRETACPR
jgi:hypothetical protein